MTPRVATPSATNDQSMTRSRNWPGTAWAAGRAWLYDRMFRALTAGWYRAAFERFPDGAQVLDVGIGTGAALVRCADLLADKDLHVVGLDIDSAYLVRCRAEITAAGLADRVVVRQESVEAHGEGPYDVVYFGASLMVLPDPVAALRQARSRLAPGGQVFFTQTFQHRRSPVLDRLKPLAKLVTTVDFGRVTYEDEFRNVLHAAGLTITDLSTLKEKRRSSYRLAVARPAPRRAVGT